MGNAQLLEKTEIINNVKKIQAFLGKNKLDALYLSSSDIFLNEYVPLADCHRYYVTNFTGSTAEALVLKSGKVYLFVDGRYYEQADLEADPSFVEVVKVPFNESLRGLLISTAKGLKVKSIGVEGDRIDLSFFNLLSENFSVKNFLKAELASVIHFKSLDFDKKVYELSLDLVGESTKSKLERIVGENEAVYLSALDSIAWLTNLRRFELPHQSTLRAKALCTKETVYLQLEHIEGEITNPNIEVNVSKFSDLEAFLNLVLNYEKELKPKLGLKSYKIEKVIYSDRTINAADFEVLNKVFGKEKLQNNSAGLTPFHALKNPAELDSMRSSFDRADRAIFNTMKWVKDKMHKDEKISELDFYHQCNEFYKNEGAKDQSFNTIAAFGANASIVHFSSPSAEVEFKKGEFALLDSGGYFESGYATDTTRTFLSGGEASLKHKEIYTLVLKGLLHALNAVFPSGTIGSMIDGVTRQPLFKAGQNYNHGTGHGVGINVHEGGFRVSPQSTVPLVENVVGSLEPGIYIPQFGGVRLENVVVVKKHPNLEGMLCFESLVYVGFDPELIEFSMLTEEEKVWLDQYEHECHKRGRSFFNLA